MLFDKKTDEMSMREFWDWFIENEGWIIENVKTDREDVFSGVDQALAPVFYYLKKDLEYEISYNGEKWEFFFYDLNVKELNRDALKLAQMMPEDLKNRWVFIIEH